MDRNLEQWLRGDPVQPETVGDSPSEGMADDVAALLGLPVALSRFKSAAGMMPVLPPERYRMKRLHQGLIP